MVPARARSWCRPGVRPWAGSEEIAKKIPGARFEVVEEAGHFLPTTGGKTLLKLLRDFLPKS